MEEEEVLLSRCLPALAVTDAEEVEKVQGEAGEASTLGVNYMDITSSFLSDYYAFSFL